MWVQRQRLYDHPNPPFRMHSTSPERGVVWTQRVEPPSEYSNTAHSCGSLRAAGLMPLQNFQMLLLGDNYWNFQRGLPPEQSRDDPARRKVSSLFLLFLALYPSPPKPPPIKESFNIHQRRNLAPTLSLPPLTCIDAEAPPSHFKKKKNEREVSSKEVQEEKEEEKECWAMQDRLLAAAKSDKVGGFQAAVRLAEVSKAAQLSASLWGSPLLPLLHDTIARFTR